MFGQLFGRYLISYLRKRLFRRTKQIRDFSVPSQEKLPIDFKVRWISITCSSVWYSSTVQFALRSLEMLRTFHEVFGKLAKDKWIILYLSRIYTKPILYLAHTEWYPNCICMCIYMLELFKKKKKRLEFELRAIAFFNKPSDLCHSLNHVRVLCVLLSFHRWASHSCHVFWCNFAEVGVLLYFLFYIFLFKQSNFISVPGNWIRMWSHRYVQRTGT